MIELKQTFKITFCGIIAALAAVFMLFSYFPYLTYSIPAVSGLMMMILVIELGEKWAFCAFIASSVIVFLTAENESKLMYICFLGYYPILKAIIEKIGKQTLEWILKIVAFNTAIIIVYLIFSNLFGIGTEDFNELGKYGAYIFLGIGNITFIIYDFAISRLAGFYMIKLHPKISQMFKN